MEADGKSRNDSEFPRQPLVSVERQIETNLETGRSQTRMFVKMYFEARDSGLLAALPAELWQTLCCLATYMDVDGYCYPGQRRMARELGISRQQLNARLQKLVAFRFQGRPVIHVTKERRGGGGQWARNIYKVLPISGLGIFGDKLATPPEVQPARGRATRPVSTRLDTESVSNRTDAASLDMNQSPKGNEITQPVCLGRKASEAKDLLQTFHARIGRAPSRATPKELRQATDLIEAHGRDVAQFIAEYAISQAAITRFRMRHFGAVCSYVDEAMAELRRRRTRKAHQDHDRERRCEEDLRISYEAWRRVEVERLKRRMDPTALDVLEAATRASLFAEYGSKLPPAAETLVRIRIIEEIAAKESVMNFGEWKASQAAHEKNAARPAVMPRGAQTFARRTLAAPTRSASGA